MLIEDLSMEYGPTVEVGDDHSMSAGIAVVDEHK